MPRIVEPPRHWQDWASWTLGFWLILSPWVLMYAFDRPAMETAVVTGFLLLVVEAVTLSAFQPWEEWANVALGGWLIAASLLLGVKNVSAMIDFVVVGLLVVVLALNEMRETMRKPSRGV